MTDYRAKFMEEYSLHPTVLDAISDYEYEIARCEKIYKGDAETCFSNAIENGHEIAVQRFFSAVRPAKRKSLLSGAILKAVHYGRCDMVNEIVKLAGLGRFCYVDLDMDVAVSHAAERGYADIVLLLISNGASLKHAYEGAKTGKQRNVIGCLDRTY